MTYLRAHFQPLYCFLFCQNDQIIKFWKSDQVGGEISVRKGFRAYVRDCTVVLFTRRCICRVINFVHGQLKQLNRTVINGQFSIGWRVIIGCRIQL
jgi:hypothetical protein